MRPVCDAVAAAVTEGRALEPTLLALTRWGARFLTAPLPGDHVEPDWLTLAVDAFARKGPTPSRRFELRPTSGEREAVLRVGGGPDGTYSIQDDLAVEASIQAPMMVMMALMSGAMTPDAVLAVDGVRVEGDVETLSDLPDLFEMSL